MIISPDSKKEDNLDTDSMFPPRAAWVLDLWSEVDPPVVRIRGADPAGEHRTAERECPGDLHRDRERDQLAVAQRSPSAAQRSVEAARAAVVARPAAHQRDAIDAAAALARQLDLRALTRRARRRKRPPAPDLLPDVLDGHDPQRLVQERGLGVVTDTGAIDAAIDAAMQADPATVEKVRAGNAKAMNALFGPVMKATGGQATRRV